MNLPEFEALLWQHMPRATASQIDALLAAAVDLGQAMCGTAEDRQARARAEVIEVLTRDPKGVTAERRARLASALPPQRCGPVHGDGPLAEVRAAHATARRLRHHGAPVPAAVTDLARDYRRVTRHAARAGKAADRTGMGAAA